MEYCKEDFEFSREQQIASVRGGFRHVVILGAGASKASCINNPEKNNKSIPLMNDLPKIIDLENELKDLAPSFRKQNFELIFSKLSQSEPNSKRLEEIENKIYNYFRELELPDSPTIYDYLVLSLRNKDLIATFNWDPFLWQAYERVSKFTQNLPLIVFLHGNVAIGYSEESKTYGPNRYLNPKTRRPYEPTRLLYPVDQKNYNSDNFIKSQWESLSYFLTNPARVTIFGYSAPKTDVEAISIMQKAWGNPEIDQSLTQFEVIDIQHEEKILKSWENFVFSHHYEITNDFFESSIFRCPRRTGEVYNAQYIEAKFFESNPPPKFKMLEEMFDWFKNLIESEKVQAANKDQS